MEKMLEIISLVALAFGKLMILVEEPITTIGEFLVKNAQVQHVIVILDFSHQLVDTKLIE